TQQPPRNQLLGRVGPLKRVYQHIRVDEARNLFSGHRDRPGSSSSHRSLPAPSQTPVSTAPARIACGSVPLPAPPGTPAPVGSRSSHGPAPPSWLQEEDPPPQPESNSGWFSPQKQRSTQYVHQTVPFLCV